MIQNMKRLVRMLFGVPVAILMTIAGAILLAIFGTHKWAYETEGKNHISNVVVAGTKTEIKKYWQKALT